MPSCRSTSIRGSSGGGTGLMNSILISSGAFTIYVASAGFFLSASHDTTRCEISMASLPLHPDSRQNEMTPSNDARKVRLDIFCSSRQGKAQ